MKRLFKLFIAGAPVLATLIFIAYRHTASSITPVNDFSVITQKLSTLDSNSLVIFDVDRVLLIETDPYERGHRTERKKSNTIASILQPESYLVQHLDRATRYQLWALYVQGLGEVLIDNQIPSLIAAMQERDAKVIALTRFLTGTVGSIPAIEDVRINQLKAMGIHFSTAFAGNETIIFNQFSFDDRHPLFKDGMLFTSLACNKGDLLTAFLKTINWMPTKIIMFDDKFDNLTSVRNAAQKLSIPFHGYQYMAASTLPEYFDKEAAEFQMNYLMQHHEWISRDRAQELLNTSHNQLHPVTP